MRATVVASKVASENGGDTFFIGGDFQGMRNLRMAVCVPFLKKTVLALVA